jgi:hypothetical protein
VSGGTPAQGDPSRATAAATAAAAAARPRHAGSGEVQGGQWVRVFTEEYVGKRGDYTRRFLAASYAVSWVAATGGYGGCSCCLVVAEVFGP